MPVISQKEKLSIYALYFCFGLGLIAAAPRANDLKHNLNVSNQSYGLLTTLGAIGAISAFLYSGHFVHSFGVRRTLIFSNTLIFFLNGLIPHLHIWWLYLIVSIIMGAGIACYNAAAHELAVARQNHYQIQLVSGLQGSWSIGVLLTSLFAFLISSHLSFAVHIDSVVSISWLASMLAIYNLRKVFSQLPLHEAETSFSLDQLKKSFNGEWDLILGLSLGILIEFVAGDWTAIVVHQEILGSISVAIGTYFLFVLAMILGRMFLPRFSEYFGESKILVLATTVGGGIALLGFQLGHHLAKTDNNLALILEAIGFFFAGIGTSVVSPIFTNATVKSSKSPTSVALSQLWLTNSILIMILRAFISYVVGQTSISFALIIPSVMLIGTAFFAKRIKVIYSKIQ